MPGLVAIPADSLPVMQKWISVAFGSKPPIRTKRDQNFFETKTNGPGASFYEVPKQELPLTFLFHMSGIRMSDRETPAYDGLANAFLLDFGLSISWLWGLPRPRLSRLSSNLSISSLSRPSWSRLAASSRCNENKPERVFQLMHQLLELKSLNIFEPRASWSK